MSSAVLLGFRSDVAVFLRWTLKFKPVESVIKMSVMLACARLCHLRDAECFKKSFQ